MKHIYYLSFILLFGCSCGDFSSLESSGSTQSGSYANMLTLGNYLYIISENDIATFDISDRANPKELNREILPEGQIESLFHFAGQLFIGSRENLFIYDINANGIPERISATNYSQDWEFGLCASDPVVVNDSIAYVTLSSTTTRLVDCRLLTENLNELRLYDITNSESPELIDSRPMSNPKGLGLDGNYLFVCDDGLKVFDVSDANNLDQIYHFDGFDSYDVITQNGLLLVVGPDDLYQYDYKDIDNMSLISELEL